MERLSTEAFNRRMFSNEDENWKAAKSTSCEENAHSKQHISFDLCLVFACHTASKKRSAEMAIFTTVAVFFWKASAFPLDHSSEEKRGTKRRRTVDTKQESKLRNASTKSHLQPTSIAEIRFSQGIVRNFTQRRNKYKAYNWNTGLTIDTLPTWTGLYHVVFDVFAFVPKCLKTRKNKVIKLRKGCSVYNFTLKINYSV